jgi:ArsR family transcriptional regulator
MDDKDQKARLFEQFALVGKAVSHPARLQLLDLLSQGERSVEVLAVAADLSVTNTSNHLKTLRLAGLVHTRRDGQFVHYALADHAVGVFLRSLQDIAKKRSATVRAIIADYLHDPSALDPIRARELLDRLRADDVVLIDVRPEDEYAAGHIPGAVSMPTEQVEARLAELPTDREVVAYCRGPYCVFSLRALEILRARGFRARRLEEGITDWRAMGLPVATGRLVGGGAS